jgi:glycosyltransferase involved in cell wall biosynthesis
MTKLIIQIPCYNEAATLPVTLAALPTSLAGVDAIETLIVDDGSTDRTVEAAQQAGADHIVRFTANRGLAKAFMAGLDACLARGADIIVNTDADNQYSATDIPKLIAPILAGQADMVVGCRPIENMAEFSWLKKRLQRWGSRFVRSLSGLDIPDATSGFRAISREAALQLTVISDFTYTIETLIEAGKKSIPTTWVPVSVNRQMRPSRLFKGTRHYLRRAGPAMLRIYAMYEPLKVFAGIGTLLMLMGSLPIARFLYLFFTGHGSGHVQSLVLGGVVLLVGFQVAIIGLLSDLIAANRRLVEDTLYRVRRREARDHPSD